MDEKKKTFRLFYETVFKAEHRHPLNIGLHVIGTILSVLFLCYWAGVAVWSGFSLGHLWLLAYPVVHAAPGLLGHKLFEPNASVGDIRVFRRDYPGYWFLFGNHVMTYELISGQWKSS